jgi:hypothetical protein
MTRRISVRPAGFGWTLSIDGQNQASIYASGALAERTARRLAERLAHAGEACEIEIYLRDGSLAGMLRSTPDAPGAGPLSAPLVQMEPAAA